MSRFVDTNFGKINLHYIISARHRRPKGEHPYVEITYLEGQTVLTARTFAEIDLETYTAPVVPAAPGYSVVAVLGPPPYQVLFEPVIAWRILYDHAQPISPGDGVTSGSDPWGILLPTGKVRMPFDCTYRSVDDFLREESARLETSPPHGHCMTGKAAGAPYPEFKNKGWTDAQLIEHGYMVKVAA